MLTERDAFLEIRDSKSHELITVIELLSPANKRAGSDRAQYLAKREQVLSSTVHLVEIDLLRGGQRMPVDGLPDCDYCVLVSHAAERPRVGIWAIGLADALPTIPIPLRGDDAPAQLDLRAALDRVYDQYIYAGQPAPALRGDQAEWARQVASNRG